MISRDQSKFDSLIDELNSEQFNARGFAADASDEQELQSAFDKIVQWNDDLEVLIYNASAMVSDNVLAITPDKMLDKMALNLCGAICSVNQVLPLMRARKSGTILMTGGGLALEPYPDWASLGVGKAALRSYSIALHKALVPENIHVAVIAVCGIVEEGGLFDPDSIAEEYWKLYSESKMDWRRELVYLPEGADADYNRSTGG